MLIDHPTILRNVPESIVMPASMALDVPEMLWTGGPAIVSHYPWKFDVSIKHPLRELLRGSFLDWSKAGSPGTIEAWAEKHDKTHLQLVTEGRSKSLADTANLTKNSRTMWLLQDYSEGEWFKYPDAIKKYIEAGRLRGYEGGEIL